jgi:hypothetical protein
VLHCARFAFLSGRVKCSHDMDGLHQCNSPLITTCYFSLLLPENLAFGAKSPLLPREVMLVSWRYVAFEQYMVLSVCFINGCMGNFQLAYVVWKANTYRLSDV